MGRVSTALLFLLAFSFFSCHDDSTAPTTSDLQLTAGDIAVTDVSLRLQVAPNLHKSPSTLTLIQDGKGIGSIPNPPADTTFIISGLAPKSNHIFQTKLQISNHSLVASDPLTLTTMDTTSHDFTWESDTLGDGVGSILRGVAIINDTLGYAVGAVYKLDSSGQAFEPLPYNLVKWDGTKWSLSRVTIMFRGNPVTPPLEGIHVNSGADIWLAGGIPIHGDGVNWTGYDIQALVGTGADVSKIWGNTNETYFVGRTGNLIHYANGVWQKLQSGTTMKISDIWGAHRKSGDWEIVAVAGDYNVNSDRKILSITGINVTQQSDNGVNGALSCIWFSPNRNYLIGGDGIWEKHTSLSAPTWEGGANIITTYTTDAMRGTDVNNIFLCGSFGDCVHYNGISWHSFQSETGVEQGHYLAIDIYNNIVFAVGDESDRAIVARGVRVGQP